MSTHTAMFETVMVGVDGGARGRDALALAHRLAVDGELVLAHVYGEAPAAGCAAEPASARAGWRARDLLARTSHLDAPEAATVVAHDASPQRGLRRAAARVAPDLLVLGSSHRAGLGRVLLLDDALHDLDGLACAVAVAPRGYAFANGRLRAIGVGHDGRPGSDRVLSLARELAARHGARLRILCAAPRPPAGLTAHDVELVGGDPAVALQQLSAQVDLLVLGSAGSATAGQTQCGSTVTTLAHGSRCPLLVVPQPVGSAPARLAPGTPAPARRSPARPLAGASSGR